MEAIGQLGSGVEPEVMANVTEASPVSDYAVDLRHQVEGKRKRRGNRSYDVIPFQTNENATKNVRCLSTFIHRKYPSCVFHNFHFGICSEKKIQKDTNELRRAINLFIYEIFLRLYM